MANAVPEIPDWAAQNYRDLVEDETRPETYESIAVEAERMNDNLLAAWARAQVDDPDADDEELPPPPQPYEALKLDGPDGLKALAEERGIDTAELKLKADYVAALEAADEQAAQAAGNPVQD